MNKNDVTIDDLARMVTRGFEEVKNEIGGVKDELHELRKQNKRDHTELKLRQDNMAYRFELQDLTKSSDLYYYLNMNHIPTSGIESNPNDQANTEPEFADLFFNLYNKRQNRKDSKDQ